LTPRRVKRHSTFSPPQRGAPRRLAPHPTDRSTDKKEEQ
jgi:hypothetical protein